MIPPLTLKEVRVLWEVAHRSKGRRDFPVQCRISDGGMTNLVSLGYLVRVPPPKMGMHGIFFSITEKGLLRLTDPARLLAIEVLET